MNLPNKKYKIIYADPPWFYTDKRENPSSDRPKKYGGISYQVMKIDELCNLPIKHIAEKDAILFLWTTMPLLQKSFKVMNAWGFEYRTCGFVWVKTTTKGIRSGLGKYTNSNAELCLIGLNGKYLSRKDKSIKQIVLSPVTNHSKKPSEVRERIVKLYGNLPRIELFARERIEGWDVWGNEAPNQVQCRIEDVSAQEKKK